MRTAKEIFATAKKLLPPAISIAALILILAYLSGAFHTKVKPERLAAPAQADAAQAEWHEVRQVELPVYEQAPGSVQAALRTAVSARLLATIKAINVRAGDSVGAGDVLIELDDRELRARADQAQQVLNSAESSRDNAQVEFERYRKLLAEGVASQQELDRAETALKVAQAEFERAEDAVQEARIALTYSTISAPVAGRIVERLAEPGDTAAPGVPLLQIYDPDSLQLEAAVRESLAARLEKGRQLQARIDALNKTLPARVNEIVPQAETGSRVFRVKVDLPRDENLYTGMFGRLIIPNGSRPALLIPRRAVEAIGQNRFVQLRDERNRIVRRMITLGEPVDEQFVEVLSGLKAGEFIRLWQ